MNRASGGVVSVVIPFYGGEEFVAQCIESVLSQTYRNLDIILVDDGSPDRSGEICDDYARMDQRIRVIHQANSGLVNARKAGVEAATGTYLSFVDGDDWIGPTHLERLHELMASDAADLAIGGHTREFMGRMQPIRPRINPGVYERTEIEHDILPQAIFNGTFFQHGVSTYVWNKMFKLDTAVPFIRRIPSEIVMGEDAALTYPYLASSSRVAVTHESEYFYRQRPRSIVKSVPEIDAEFARLSVLFRFLHTSFAGAPTSAHIGEQLRHYFHALVLTRSGGIIQTPTDEPWFSPFQGLSTAQRVVVCSSGSFGQHLVDSLRRIGVSQLAGWVDEDAEESQRLGLPVTTLESIADMNFDLVLIASIDPEYSHDITRQLQALGVAQEKISHVLPDESKLEAALVNAGFDLESYEFTAKPHEREST